MPFGSTVPVQGRGRSSAGSRRCPSSPTAAQRRASRTTPWRPCRSPGARGHEPEEVGAAGREPGQVRGYSHGARPRAGTDLAGPRAERRGRGAVLEPVARRGSRRVDAAGEGRRLRGDGRRLARRDRGSGALRCGRAGSRSRARRARWRRSFRFRRPSTPGSMHRSHRSHCSHRSHRSHRSRRWGRPPFESRARSASPPASPLPTASARFPSSPTRRRSRCSRLFDVLDVLEKLD